MPRTATVTGPGGRTATLTIPDGATDAQISDAGMKAKAALGGEEGGGGSAGWLPTIERVAGGVGGAVVGGMVGGPVGMAVGGGLGAGLGDVAGQVTEINRGARDSYNPIATAAQAGLGAIVPGGEGVVAGAVRGAAFGGLSATVMSLAEKKEIPPAGELALGTLTGAFLGGAGGSFAARRARAGIASTAANEVAGPEVAREMSQMQLPGIVPTAVRDNPVEHIVNEELFPATPRAALRGSAGQFIRPTSKAVQLDLKLPEQTSLPGLEPAGTTPLPYVPRGHTSYPTDPPLPDEKALSGGLRILSRFTPRYSWFARAEQQTGVPLYTEMYSKVEKGSIAHLEELNQHSVVLKDIFKGVSNATRGQMQDWLEAADDFRPKLAASNGWDARTVAKANQLDKFWDDLLVGVGSNRDEFIRDVVPKLRRAGGDIDAAFPVEKPAVVKVFKKILDLEHSDSEAGLRTLLVDPKDRDALDIALRYTRAVSYQKNLAAPWEEAYGKFVGNEFGRKYGDDIRIPVESYLNEVRGVPDRLSRNLTRWYSDVATKLGHSITEREAKETVDTLIGLQYGATLAWRPAPIIKNLFQGIQTAYPLMGNAYFDGVRAAKTDAGRRLVEEFGVIAGEPGPLHEVAAMVSSSPTMQKLATFTKKGLAWYKNGDDFHRSSVFLGQFRATMKAAERADGNAIAFLGDRKANLSRFLKPVQDQVLSAFTSGDLRQAAGIAGRAQADRTQFIYRAGNRPEILSGTAGKALLGLTSWGSFYADLMHQIALGPGSLRDRTRDLARWGAASAGIVAALGGVNSAIGVSNPFARVMQWVALGPLSIGLGPGGEAIQTGSNALGELAQGNFGGPEQRKALKVPALLVPGSSALRDLNNLRKAEQGPKEALARYLGIAPRSKVYSR